MNQDSKSPSTDSAARKSRPRVWSFAQESARQYKPNAAIPTLLSKGSFQSSSPIRIHKDGSERSFVGPAPADTSG
ncbi:hypothetical protein A5724_10830 [Mycobacterium sp. ACS1612]|nr:hypothetical protein A5724_10830 [Mycobacterium sp. ACS1612]